MQARPRPVQIFIITLIVIAAAPIAALDQITLKGGEVLNGDIGRMRSNETEIMVKGQLRIIPKDRSVAVTLDIDIGKDEYWADLSRGRIVDVDLIRYKLKKSIQAFPESGYNRLYMAKLLVRNGLFAEADDIMAKRTRAEFELLRILSRLKRSGPDGLTSAVKEYAADDLTPQGRCDHIFITSLIAGDRGDFPEALAVLSGISNQPPATVKDEFNLIVRKYGSLGRYTAFLDECISAKTNRDEMRMTFHREYVVSEIDRILPTPAQIEEKITAGEFARARELLKEFNRDPDNEPQGRIIAKKIDTTEAAAYAASARTLLSSREYSQALEKARIAAQLLPEADEYRELEKSIITAHVDDEAAAGRYDPARALAKNYVRDYKNIVDGPALMKRITAAQASEQARAATALLIKKEYVPARAKARSARQLMPEITDYRDLETRIITDHIDAEIAAGRFDAARSTALAYTDEKERAAERSSIIGRIDAAEAASAFESARTLREKKENNSAITPARRAAALIPDNADYRKLVADIEYDIDFVRIRTPNMRFNGIEMSYTPWMGHFDQRLSTYWSSIRGMNATATIPAFTLPFSVYAGATWLGFFNGIINPPASISEYTITEIIVHNGARAHWCFLTVVDLYAQAGWNWMLFGERSVALGVERTGAWSGFGLEAAAGVKLMIVERIGVFSDIGIFWMHAGSFDASSIVVRSGVFRHVLGCSPRSYRTHGRRRR